MKLSTILLDKDLIRSLVISIIYFLYTKAVLLILLHIPDNYLSHLIKPIIIKKNDDSSDDSSDESDESSNNNIINPQYNTLDEYNTYIQLWEYDVILHLFNLQKYSYNILNHTEVSKIKTQYTYNYNILNNLKDNNINIIDSFLFNIKVSKCLLRQSENTISFQSKYPFKYKLILFNYINNNYINSKSLHKLFPQFKYLFILYRTNSQYKYVLVDLYNNYNLIKRKNNLFNKIIIN